MAPDWNASSEVQCSATRVNAATECNLFLQSTCFLSPCNWRLVSSNSRRVLFEESCFSGRRAWKIGKQALICIINFVVIHIFEQRRKRYRLNLKPVLIGTACGSFLTFTSQFNLLNWNYLAPLLGGDLFSFLVVHFLLCNNITQRYFYFSPLTENFLSPLCSYSCLLVDFKFCIPCTWI